MSDQISMAINPCFTPITSNRSDKQLQMLIINVNKTSGQPSISSLNVSVSCEIA